IEQAADAVLPRVQQLAAGQRHEAVYSAIERVERQCALALWRVQLHRRDEPRQVLVARAGSDENGQDELMIDDCRLRIAAWKLGVGNWELGRRLPECQLRADDRLQPGGGGGLVEAGRAVEAVAIDQRDGRIAKRSGAFREGFGQRSALEK